jgi:hypothetical protein
MYPEKADLTFGQKFGDFVEKILPQLREKVVSLNGLEYLNHLICNNTPEG